MMKVGRLICTAIAAMTIVGLGLGDPSWADNPIITPESDGASLNARDGGREPTSGNYGSSSANANAGEPSDELVTESEAEVDTGDDQPDDQCVNQPVPEIYIECLTLDSQPVQPAQPPANPAGLAVQAMSQLRVPKTAAEIRPMMTFGDGTTGGLTGLPLWLWVDGSSWEEPLIARVQAGSVWAEAKAIPVSQRWDFGDGNGIICEGPGTPYEQGMDALEGSPDCGYTYRRTSKDEPDSAYTVTSTITWRVTWVGSGNTAGELEPLRISDAITYTVRQARAQLVAPPG